jgi:predicted nuclease of predicted toxin-antitoxin system
LKFLVDSAVSPLLAAELRRIGHDAVHTVERGLVSSADEIVLLNAFQEGRIVVTSDTDFGELLAQSGASRPSVILFRRSSGKPAAEFELLAIALKNSEVLEALLLGAVIVLDPRRVRIRRLPVGRQDE